MKTRVPAVVAAALIGVGSLAACGGNDTVEPADPSTGSTATSPEAEETETSAEPDETATSAEAEEPTTDSGSAPAGEAGTPVAVDETITDDVMGDTITITHVMKGFPSTEFPAIAEDGGEFVLVEVAVTAGDLYSGGVQGGFSLLSDGETAGAATTILDGELAAAGMTPFDGVDGGETGAGWVVFQVNVAKDSYELNYTRSAATIIGSDDTIEEQVWTVPLP